MVEEEKELTEEEKQELEKEKVIAWLEGQKLTKRQFIPEASKRFWEQEENEERERREAEERETEENQQ